MSNGLKSWEEITTGLRDIGYLPDNPFNIECTGKEPEKAARELFENARAVLAKFF